MTNYRQIKIPADVFAEHKERKNELGLTWAEYLEKESVEVKEAETIDYDEIESRMERVIDGSTYE